MANPPKHFRCTWSGTLGTANPAPEIFSIGLSFSPGTSDSLNDAGFQDLLEITTPAFADAWKTHVVDQVQPAVRLKRTRLSLIGADGKTEKYANGAYKHFDQVDDAPGTSAILNGMPFQIAYAVTLQSAQTGQTGRGRFFLPLPGANAEPADGLISVARQTAFADAMADFVNACDAAALAGWTGQHVVASGGSVTQGVAPGLRPITEVKCGRVLDTMRSRRGELTELYVSRLA